MADDDDIIYVDIEPRLDDSEAERAAGKLRDRFKDAGKSIADSLKEAGHAGFDSLEQYAEKWIGDLGKTISSKGIPGALDDIGKSAQTVTGTVADLGKAFGVDLEGIRGFGKDASDAMGNVSKAVDSLNDALGGKLPKAIQDLTGKSDDFDKSLESMQGLLGQVDGKLPGVAGHFAELGKTALEAAAAVKGTYDVFSTFDDWASKHLPGTPSPNAGQPPIPEWGPDWMKRNPFGKSEDQLRQWWDAHTPRWMHPFRPGPSAHGPAPAPPPGAADSPGWNPALQLPTSPGMFGGGAGAHQSGFGVPIIQGPGGTWTSPDPAWAHLIQRESGGNPSITQQISDVNSGGNEASGLFQIARGTWVGHGGGAYAPTAGQATPEQQADIAARIFGANGGSPWGAGLPGRESASALGAALSSGGISLPVGVGSEKGLQRDTIDIKRAVSALFPQITDIGGYRPPDGYNEHSSGQAIDVMIPNAGTPQGKALGDQISAYALGSGLSDYTIWQHGQHNPDGSFQMYPDRGGPTQNHMDHVHIHTRGGGYPTGAENFSLPGGYSHPAQLTGYGASVGAGPGQVPGPLPGEFGPASGATLPNVSQGRPYSPQTPEQLGSGKGFGLTGGGLLGLAEQLPGMAASAAGGAASMFGGGAAGGAAAAAFQDLVVPQINLAAQKGGQMIATAAMAPIEEGWLGGGMMGAPSVGSPAKAGWTGKLLSGLIGTQFQMPNVAGAGAPPKKQDDHGSDQVTDNSSGSGKPGGKGAGGGGKAKSQPTGHQDDPIHVKNVGGQQNPPQNTATSAHNYSALSGVTTV
ncbi:MAG: transglycosylase family protein [Mycobacterium sp.]|nr:transglycosylase family protein [Mycobacterium sp.]